MMSMVKVCPFCKRENPDDFNYCSNCGNPLFNFKDDIVYSNKLIIILYVVIFIVSWLGVLLQLFFKFNNNFSFIGFIGLFLPFFFNSISK